MKIETGNVIWFVALMLLLSGAVVSGAVREWQGLSRAFPPSESITNVMARDAVLASEAQDDAASELGFVGIIIRPVDGGILVIAVGTETPAERAGMRTGDMIVGIDGQSTIDMGLKEAVGLLRGKPGTPVSMKIQDLGDDSIYDVRVTRDALQADQLPACSRKKLKRALERPEAGVEEQGE